MIIRSEGTRLQIQTWLENAVRRAQSPDPREKMRRRRKEKMKKVAKNYGL